MLTKEEKEALQDELWRALEVGPATADEALCRLPEKRQAQLSILPRADLLKLVSRNLDALTKVTTVYATGTGKARAWSTTPPPKPQRNDALRAAVWAALSDSGQTVFDLWAQVPVEAQGDPRMARECLAAVREILGDLVKEQRALVTGRGEARRWRFNESHVDFVRRTFPQIAPEEVEAICYRCVAIQPHAQTGDRQAPEAAYACRACGLVKSVDKAGLEWWQAQDIGILRASVVVLAEAVERAPRQEHLANGWPLELSCVCCQGTNEVPQRRVVSQDFYYYVCTSCMKTSGIAYSSTYAAHYKEAEEHWRGFRKHESYEARHLLAERILGYHLTLDTVASMLLGQECGLGSWPHVRLQGLDGAEDPSPTDEEATAPTVEEAGAALASEAPAPEAPVKKPRAKVKAAEPAPAFTPAPVEPDQWPAQLEVRYLQILSADEPTKIERIWTRLPGELRALLGDADDPAPPNMTPQKALLAHLQCLERIGVLREIPKGWLLANGHKWDEWHAGANGGVSGEALAWRALSSDWSDLTQIAERVRADGVSPWLARWAIRWGLKTAYDASNIWRLRWALALLVQAGRVEVCQGWDEGAWKGSEEKPRELLAWRWSGTSAPAPQEPQPATCAEVEPIAEAACNTEPPADAPDTEKLSTGPTPDPVYDGVKNGQKVLYRSVEQEPISDPEEPTQTADQIIAEQEARRRTLRRARRATERGRRRTDAEMAQEELHLFKLLLRGPMVRPGAQVEAVLAEMVEARFATFDAGVWRAPEGVKLETFRSWSRGKPLMEVVE